MGERFDPNDNLLKFVLKFAHLTPSIYMHYVSAESFDTKNPKNSVHFYIIFEVLVLTFTRNYFIYSRDLYVAASTNWPFTCFMDPFNVYTSFSHRRYRVM